VAILNIKNHLHNNHEHEDHDHEHKHEHEDHDHEHKHEHEDHDHEHKHDQANDYELTNVALKVGHTIGNLHRPLKIENHNIIFPIQSPDEINLFLRLLSDLKDYIEIRSEQLIFEPDQGFDIHAH